MKSRLPSMKPAEVIRVLERNGFRLLRSTKHRTYTDDAHPPVPSAKVVRRARRADANSTIMAKSLLDASQSPATAGPQRTTSILSQGCGGVPGVANSTAGVVADHHAPSRGEMRGEGHRQTRGGSSVTSPTCIKT